MTSLRATVAAVEAIEQELPAAQREAFLNELWSVVYKYEQVALDLSPEEGWYTGEDVVEPTPMLTKRQFHDSDDPYGRLK